jgi:glutamyl/glutaminyl-tRNA synthetase
VWGFARARGGRVLLRIEDHDRGRCRPEYERGILEDLDWLGFVPDNGGTAAFRSSTSRFRQSDNLARYAEALATLERAGLAYACDCSRSGIARALEGGDQPADAGAEGSGDRMAGQDPRRPRSGITRTAGIVRRAQEKSGVEPRYPGTCRGRELDAARINARRVRMEAGSAEHFVDLRLGAQQQDPDLQCGDVLARDRNGNFTYQFAAVVDDLDQGSFVDLVIRGEDILSSTGRQIRLARLLGRATPPAFLHHPLVRTRDGRKLSKSAGDTGIRELRARGRTREQVLGEAARLSGLHESGALLSIDELPGLFG